jgi:hypothetical protein
MTQVLQYDYGKGKVTLPEIRSAIKAVRAAKGSQAAGKGKAKAPSKARGNAGAKAAQGA